MNTLLGRASSLLIGLATAIVIVTVAVLPFLTPQWIGFEQGRADATAWTGYSVDELKMATDGILSDLVFGPPAFDIEVRGEAVLGERERGHMRDVRSIFGGLWVLAAVSVVVLRVASRRRDKVAAWRAARRGALGLAGAIVVLGAVALVAFRALFELFHRMLFPAGSYTFDAGSERLVQLFPFQFWQETAIAVGVVIVVLALLVAVVAGRRAAGAAQPVVGAEPVAVPEPGR